MAARGALVRSAAVVLVATLLAIQVVRTALVSLPFAERPAIAGRLWPDHPRLLIEQAMAEIGAAAAEGRNVDPATTARVDAFARKAPLAADPFLIEGAIAQTEGRRPDSERLFVEAKSRNPRSGAARYFLADLHFRANRIAEGLVEMAALARFESRAAAPFVPALVAYSRTPGAVPQLRRFFRARPDIEPTVLSVLAGDAANADLVLRLATRTRGEAAQDWQIRLITKLTDSGQYEKAHSIWARLNGVEARPGLFNPGFADLPAPPPFAWQFPESGDGLAEPAKGGRLAILYYGRNPAVLASQLLRLEPGRYRLAMDVAGDGQPTGLHWSLRCANHNQKILTLPLRGGKPSAGFAVASNCPAQWLELRGSPGEFPRTVEMTIGGLRLARERAS